MRSGSARELWPTSSTLTRAIIVMHVSSRTCFAVKTSHEALRTSERRGASVAQPK